jgi:hypothetical protein
MMQCCSKSGFDDMWAVHEDDSSLSINMLSNDSWLSNMITHTFKYHVRL